MCHILSSKKNSSVCVQNRFVLNLFKRENLYEELGRTVCLEESVL